MAGMKIRGGAAHWARRAVAPVLAAAALLGVTGGPGRSRRQRS